MKKNIILSLLVLVLVAGSYFAGTRNSGKTIIDKKPIVQNDNKKPINNGDQNTNNENEDNTEINNGDVQDNYNPEVDDKIKFEEDIDYDLEKLGDDVVEGFYDKENNEIIEDWVSSDENNSFSKKGDVIEFLTFCEKLNKANDDNKEIKKVSKEFFLRDINNVINNDENFKNFYTENKDNYKEGAEYLKGYNTSLFRAYFNADKANMGEEPDPYIMNEIYSYINEEISKDEFVKVSNKVIDMGIQGSKLYTGLYLDFFTSENSIVCSDVLKKYGELD